MDIRLNRSFYLFLIICFTSNAYGQIPLADTISVKQASALTGTLAQQYNEVVIRSGSYKIYKNIKKTKIEELWKNVKDSLQQQKQLLLQSKADLEKNSQSISAMQAEIEDLKAANSPIKILSNENDTTLLWGLIALLTAGITLVIYRSRSTVQEVKEQNERHEELNTEFHKYKSKAAEKERKLARELQDERNLVNELKAR